MKVARLLSAALVIALVAAWTASSEACDRNKSAKAQATAAAAHGVVCTPEMMAACMASLAAGGPDLCKGMKASAVTAQAAGGCSYQAGRATAVVAAAGGKHCQGGKVTAMAAGAGGACAAKSAAVAAGGCAGHGMASMAAVSGHPGCEACTEMGECNGALETAGAQRQVVRLKNGIMYIYTADSPRSVNAVQAAVSHRAERLAQLASAGAGVKLCPECKAMRGAMASGKLRREVVNIEGGSLTVVTSSDAGIVAKLHAMADDKVATQVKG